MVGGYNLNAMTWVVAINVGVTVNLLFWFIMHVTNTRRHR